LLERVAVDALSLPQRRWRTIEVPDEVNAWYG
jgi:hypothetical protein